jgi:hypothetical protein
VPNVALRFDYQSTEADYTPFYSLYYTDFVGTYPAGLGEANLFQTNVLADHFSAQTTSG